VLEGEMTSDKLQLFRDQFGVPYTDEQIANAKQEVEGKTEIEALIAYLQSLGHAMK
jgi:cytochrome c oxidase cbb3-type subunit 2